MRLGRPVKAIPLAFGRHEALRIVVAAIAIEIICRVFTLGVDDGEQRLDTGQLIGADTAVEGFFAAGSGIEFPDLALIDKRRRKRPAMFTDLQPGLTVRAVNDDVLTIVSGQKTFPVVTIFYRFTADRPLP